MVVTEDRVCELVKQEVESNELKAKLKKQSDAVIYLMTENTRLMKELKPLQEFRKARYKMQHSKPDEFKDWIYLIAREL